MAMQLLGIGEGTFDGLLAALVDRFAPGGEAMAIDALAGIGPDMTGDGAHRLAVGCARRQKRAAATDGGVGCIVPVAVAVGGGVGEKLALRATIAVLFAVMDELRLTHHAGSG